MNKQALTILAMAVVVGASAANLTWVGGSEGDWNTAANWDPQQVPTNNDTVFFDSTQSITVNLNKAVGITRRIRAGQFQLPYVFPAA